MTSSDEDFKIEHRRMKLMFSKLQLVYTIIRCLPPYLNHLNSTLCLPVSERASLFSGISLTSPVVLVRAAGILIQGDQKLSVHLMITTHVFLSSLLGLTLSLLMSYISSRTAPLTSRRCILYISQQIYVLNILNMLHILRSFLFKMPFV
jgi:hypothetical protein